MAWATLILYRAGGCPFGPAELEVAEACAPLVADAVRAVLLSAACDHRALEEPPGSVLLDRDDHLVLTSAAAEELLAGLDDSTVSSVLTSLAVAARVQGVARAMVAGARGLLELQASPAKGGQAGATAVVTARPRPAVLMPLVLDAFGLTGRERQVAELALGGLARRQIARGLGLTPHTVDDHLAAIHRKAGVTSHAELAALIYRRWYEPFRQRRTPSPYGHFLPD